MAAHSGLSLSNAATNHAAVEATLATSTTNWTSLARRQYRLVSGCDLALKRLQHLADKLHGMGWAKEEDSEYVKKTPSMKGQKEWEELARRQTHILESICATRDRMRSLGFQIGLTNSAHEEVEKNPALLRKIPSHFNNAAVKQFIEQSAARREDSASPQPALYRLTKLLAIITVRDVSRLIVAGTHHTLSEDCRNVLPSEEEFMQSHDSASSLPLSSQTCTSHSHFVPPSQTALFRSLLRRTFSTLLAVDMNSIPAASITRLISDGNSLAILSAGIDSDSRSIMNEEDYSFDLSVDNLKHSPAFTAALNAFQMKQGRSWFHTGVSPFAAFNFTRPPSDLTQATRVPCPKCSKPSALYCPFCLIPTLPAELTIPPVRLPLNFDILHHVGENVKKSTSIHGCILAPDHCRFLEFPAQIPKYDPNETVLLYPTADAVFLDDERVDFSHVKTVLVIESTWTKSDIVSQHPYLLPLRRIKIRDHESTFWRYQELGKHFLSTLEAIYHTCKEFEQRNNKQQKSGPSSSSAPPASNVDDLLYFYAFQHSRITERYKDGSDRAPRSWSGGAGPSAN